MKMIYAATVFMAMALNAIMASAQTCEVLIPELSGEYKGECKKGIATGQGEVKGKVHAYKGSFKNGKPNGQGTYHYSDSMFHIGNFQEGLKEGKGEMHYVLANKTDSVIAGFWSGDIYRGKRYVTYVSDAREYFDQVEINPSSRPGNTISFEITVTSTGSESIDSYLSLTQLVSTNGVFIRPLTKSTVPRKSTYSYEIKQFPVHLLATFSNGRNITFELYKNADWQVRIYLNK
jgi:hypothetical protein